MEKICIELYYLKERFNEMEIEMDSENENQLKEIRKPPLLLSQEESLSKEIKKYPCLFDKSQRTYKERDVIQKVISHSRENSDYTDFANQQLQRHVQYLYFIWRTCWQTGRVAKGNHAKKNTFAKSVTHQRWTSTINDG